MWWRLGGEVGVVGTAEGRGGSVGPWAKVSFSWEILDIFEKLILNIHTLYSF